MCIRDSSSEFLSVSPTDDVLAGSLLSGLPCIPVPFINNWLMDLSDRTPTSFGSDFEVYFEEDCTSTPTDDVVCKYLAGVHEANARWNDAYSFPVDIVSEMRQHHSRVV